MEKNKWPDELHIKHMYVATSLSIKKCFVNKIIREATSVWQFNFTHHHSRWHEYYPSNATQLKGWFMVCSEGALCRVIVMSHTRDRVFQIKNKGLLRVFTFPTIPSIRKQDQNLTNTPGKLLHSSLSPSAQWHPSHKREAAAGWTLNPERKKYTQPHH